MLPMVVGISDCQWSTSSSTDLVTYALGSCIALTIYDPQASVGGILHYMLPESRSEERRVGKECA